MRAARIVVLVALLVGLISSCSTIAGWFGGGDSDTGEKVSVFDAEVGDCFLAPDKPTVTLATLQRIDCSKEHQQELYAILTYPTPDGDDYPGDAALETFAKGKCAQAFTDYVGIAYPDSGLWATHLMPSARSWQQDKDRSVLCFVTTTEGGTLTSTVKDSKQ